MIKRTLYFGNPAYLSIKDKQLVIRIPEKTDGEIVSAGKTVTVPVEDIGLVILDNWQITFTQHVMTALLENNTAVVHCNASHHPVGMLLNLDGHTLQTQRFRAQIEATEPLKKQLWQQTVIRKIENQAALLQSLSKDVKTLDFMIRNVKSGDPDNFEARAAAYYWGQLFSEYIPDFTRDRGGEPPNNMLNYGYAILRAAVARALVGSGLLPTLGIFHRNQYNAYCLADDIMEPYRPFVDRAVLEFMQAGNKIPKDLNLDAKQHLLTVLQHDVHFDKDRSPLMVGLTKTTASLSACFEGTKRKINYPKL